jgi:hypothetical protein
MTTAREAARERDRTQAELLRRFDERLGGTTASRDGDDKMAKDSDLKRITGLWVKEKNGRKFFAGKVDEKFVLEPGAPIFIFAAKDRKNDKSPSHYLCAAPPEAQRSRSAATDDGDDVPF